MKYCPQCGAQVEDAGVFCPTCGYQFETQQASTAHKSYNSRQDAEQQDANENRAMGIMAYIGPLVFIPAFAAKGSRFAQFHANQGIWLLIAEGAASIIHALIPYKIWFLRWPIGLLWIPLTIFAVMGIIAAAKGEKKVLPLMANLPKLFK